VPYGVSCLVMQQVLLRDISNIFGLSTLCEEMIIGLVFVRPDLLRDRQPPFFGVVECGIDIKNHSSK
jgi:hypothetical protein